MKEAKRIHHVETADVYNYMQEHNLQFDHRSMLYKNCSNNECYYDTTLEINNRIHSHELPNDSVNASLAAYFDNLIEDGAITQNKAHRHSWYDGY